MVESLWEAYTKIRKRKMKGSVKKRRIKQRRIGGIAGVVEKFAAHIKALITVKKGQGFVEYAFIISFVALVIILALGVLGLRLAEIFTSVMAGLR